jgi:hypothetical protein
MALLSLKLPPGVVNNGAESESAGRFYATSQVRWIDGVLRPWGGSQLRSSASAFTGSARSLRPWRDNGGDRWIGIGTNSKLYVQREDGTNFDITPAGFSAGLADAIHPTGYGAGLYGSGTYGTPRTDTSAITPAGVWTKDNFGQYLVEANTTWTATATNQAGDQALQTSGTMMCGRGMKGQSIVLTTVDAWSMVYKGQPYIFGFTRVGQGCGIISKGALVVTDNLAAWMAKDGFYGYDGAAVQKIPCDVYDKVFGDLNTTQVSKITGVHYPAASEVRWHYPSGASNEVDRYVAYNYASPHWSFGSIDRIVACEKGPFDNPLMISSAGLLYEHETGFNATWFAETGPFQLGKGDRRLEVQRLIPDEVTQGDVTVTFYAKDYPNGAETTYGPYTMANPTDVLFQADQIRVRYTGNTLAAARIGSFKLDVIAGDSLL